MSTFAAEQEAAAELVSARRQGRALTGFPGTTPTTMAEAYRIQDQAIAQWPATLVGWKIGYIAPERRAPGEPDRLVGPIWHDQLHRGEDQGTPVEMAIFPAGFAAVEAELVVRLLEDPPAGNEWTAERAAELEQELLFGIEVASSPIPDINSLGPTVVAADFGNNNGLLLGGVLAADASPRLSCQVDDELLGEGTAERLPGGLHHGLATALEVLASRGQPVRAGMLFATGAITGIHPIGLGQHCRVAVDGGASVELVTVDAAAALGRRATLGLSGPR